MNIQLAPKVRQIPVLIFGKADIIGLASRIRPFTGQLGTVPAVNIPDSHHAGDFGSFLIDAPHPYRITKEQYERDLTDSYLDVDSVRVGAILIAPVKVKGAGVYAGDAHAMQGDGEVAGHTTDITAEVSAKVEVLKGLSLDGPILLLLEEGLPPLAKPWRKDEWDQIKSLAKRYDIEPEPVAPVQIIGSGPTINDAAANGFQRAAKLFNMSVEEVRNRVKLRERLKLEDCQGVVQVSMQVPIRILKELCAANGVAFARISPDVVLDENGNRNHRTS